MSKSCHSPTRMKCGKQQALEGMYHKLRLSTLAQMYGNCLRHSCTISPLCLTLIPALEWTLQSSLKLFFTCPFQWYAHRFKALLTLNAKFPLCTTISINVTTSSFSAAAVFAMRSSQFISSLCISARECQHITPAFDSGPTF